MKKNKLLYKTKKKYYINSYTDIPNKNNQHQDINSKLTPDLTHSQYQPTDTISGKG